MFTSLDEDYSCELTKKQSIPSSIPPQLIKKASNDFVVQELYLGFESDMKKLGSNTSIFDEPTRTDTKPFEFDLNEQEADLVDFQEFAQFTEEAKIGGDDMKITNLHVSFHLNVKIDLRKLAKNLKNAYFYNSKEQKNSEKLTFCSDRIEIRLSNPKASGFIYSSGKVYILQSKSINQAKIASKKLAKKVKMIYPEVRFSNFKVNNFSGMKKFDCKVALQKMHNDKSLKTKYEPDLYPWLRLILEENKINAHIFSTGYVIIEGAKSEEELESLFM